MSENDDPVSARFEARGAYRGYLPGDVLHRVPSETGLQGRARHCVSQALTLLGAQAQALGQQCESSFARPLIDAALEIAYGART